jgi:hypothetical protein
VNQTEGSIDQPYSALGAYAATTKQALDGP